MAPNTVIRFLNINTYLPTPKNLTREIRLWVHKKIFTRIFIAALLIITQN